MNDESHKQHDFRRKSLEHKMCVLIFSTLSFETFLIQRRFQQDIIINLHVFISSIHYSFEILIELEFCRQVFQKCSNIKFQDNPFGGNRVVSCRQTDGRTDITKLIVASRNFANAPSKVMSQWDKWPTFNDAVTDICNKFGRVHQYSIRIFSSYLKENTVRFRLKGQAVNTV